MNQAKKVGVWGLMAVFIWIAVWQIFVHQPQLRPVLTSPKAFYYHQGGDAWKNIYTPAFHAIHGDEFFHSLVYNYPEGEHIAFADGQPLLALIMRAAGVDDPATAAKIIQLLPVWACAFGAFLLALFLRRFNLPILLCVGTGIGIALLSPQMTRMSGHFGLSYVFIIPVMFHLLLSWFRTSRTVYLVGFGLFTCLMGLLHPYHLATGLLISSTFMLSSAILSPGHSFLKTVGQVLLLIVATYGISQLLIQVPFYVADRPAAPYGLSAYVSSWEDIFIDRTLPWWQYISEYLVKIRNPGSWEGRGYVGITAGVFFLVSLLILLFKVGSKLFKYHGVTLFRAGMYQRSDDALFFKLLLIAITLVALIAAGLPLELPGADFVVNHLGPVRQFRSLGRFIWVFFYGINIISFVWLYHKLKTSSYLAVVPYLLMAVVLLEGEKHLEQIISVPNPIAPKALMNARIAALGDLSDYDAILALPAYHTGSENFTEPVNDMLDARTDTELGLYTGLPNLNAHMSRQGVARSYEIPPLNNDWTEIPQILSKLPVGESLLIVLDSITQSYMNNFVGRDVYSPWMQELDTLHNGDGRMLLRFDVSPEKLVDIQGNFCRQAIDDAIEISVPADGVIQDSSSTFVKTYNDGDWSLGKEPSGLIIEGSDFEELQIWQLPVNQDSMQLRVLLHVYVHGDGLSESRLLIDVLPENNEDLISRVELLPRGPMNTYDGYWSQLRYTTPVMAPGQRLRLLVKRAIHPEVSQMHIRNLIIHPAGKKYAWPVEGGNVIEGRLRHGCVPIGPQPEPEH